MNRSSTIWVWGAITGATGLFLWMFGPVLTPFVVGLAVAYLLNPIVEWCGSRGLNRRFSALALVIGFVMIILGTIAILVPLLVTEMVRLADAVPHIIDQAWMVVAPYIPTDSFDVKAGNAQLAENYMAFILRNTSAMIADAFDAGRAAVSLFAFIALMPVVAYFMMKEWPYIVATIDDVLPRASADTVRRLMRDIDRRIAGFVRGQLMICAMLAVYYTLALSVVGLDYAVFVGVMSGILALIPFVGSFFAVTASVLIGAFQIPVDGWGVMMGAVAAVAIGQFVEGNFITPKIVGDRVGLHPIWVILALLCGAQVMGLLGMFLAVPVAAVVAVLMGESIARYKASHMYHGGHLMPPKTNG